MYSFSSLLTYLASFLIQTSQPTTDYLIVGGGTAGLVLAERLTENPRVSVLVLEAGGDGLGNVNISDINLIGAAWGTDIDWQFPTQPLKYANNRQLTPSPRGKVLGGSSSINGDVYERGDDTGYNEWEALGNTGWNSDSIISASKKGERFYPPKPTDNIKFILGDHGLNGNLATSYGGVAPGFHNVIATGVVNAGGVASPDQAGGNLTGISHVTNARLPKNSTRATSATGYYFPYSFRKNLKVTLNVTVTKVLWKSTTRGNAIAQGVEYVDKGVTHSASGTKVILAGGTWGSPPILERSGVGDAKFLSSLGIKSVVDLPGVGENLNEQTLVQMEWQLNSSLPSPGSPFLLNVESLQTTLGSSNLSTVESLLAISPPGLSTSLHDAHKRLLANNAPWIEGYIYLNTPAQGPSTLTWYAVNLRPLSRGSVHIVSSNGTEYPKIEYNFFQDPLDLYVMAAGAQRVQKIVSTPPLSDYVAKPTVPGPNVTSIEDLQDYIRSAVTYTNHIMGTALMAPRKYGGVVDPNLKVYGTKNVYVVDASVIPIQPASHSQATVYAVAERAAKLFKRAHRFKSKMIFM